MTFIDCLVPVFVAIVPAVDGDVADRNHVFITSQRGVFYARIECDDNRQRRKFQERVKPEYPQKKG